MRSGIAKRAEALKERRPRALMLSVGIVLFVAGFVMTVATFPAGDQAAGGESSLSSGGLGTGGLFFLATGILVSLLGVIVATVLPTAMAVKGKRKP